MSLEAEIQRRRTFAIISHPDAGKTTLTEKLLFDIQKISETEWKLTELYTNNPAIITLVKTNHQNF